MWDDAVEDLLKDKLWRRVVSVGDRGGVSVYQLGSQAKSVLGCSGRWPPRPLALPPSLSRETCDAGSLF